MNFGPAQTTEPPGRKPLVVNVVVVGPFEEEEQGTGVTSDVVKVKGEDPATPGPLKRNDPGTVTIPQYRINKSKQHTSVGGRQINRDLEFQFAQSVMIFTAHFTLTSPNLFTSQSASQDERNGSKGQEDRAGERKREREAQREEGNKQRETTQCLRSRRRRSYYCGFCNPKMENENI